MRASESEDVTQTPAVRATKYCLGECLGEFYDEECEAVFVTGDKKVCVTLLGLVMVSLLATDFVFAPHVINAKLGEIPNYYICFSSSTVALFAVRALFFVLKDWVARFSHMKYGVGVILFFVGVQLVLSPAMIVRIRVVESSLVVACIVTISMVSTILRDRLYAKALKGPRPVLTSESVTSA